MPNCITVNNHQSYYHIIHSKVFRTKELSGSRGWLGMSEGQEKGQEEEVSLLPENGLSDGGFQTI